MKWTKALNCQGHGQIGLITHWLAFGTNLNRNENISCFIPLNFFYVSQTLTKQMHKCDASTLRILFPFSDCRTQKETQEQTDSLRIFQYASLYQTTQNVFLVPQPKTCYNCAFVFKFNSWKAKTDVMNQAAHWPISQLFKKACRKRTCSKNIGQLYCRN